MTGEQFLCFFTSHGSNYEWMDILKCLTFMIVDVATDDPQMTLFLFILVFFSIIYHMCAFCIKRWWCIPRWCSIVVKSNDE